jgi:hypothetical protein
MRLTRIAAMLCLFMVGCGGFIDPPKNPQAAGPDLVREGSRAEQMLVPLKGYEYTENPMGEEAFAGFMREADVAFDDIESLVYREVTGPTPCSPYTALEVIVFKPGSGKADIPYFSLMGIAGTQGTAARSVDVLGTRIFVWRGRDGSIFNAGAGFAHHNAMVVLLGHDRTVAREIATQIVTGLKSDKLIADAGRTCLAG